MNAQFTTRTCVTQPMKQTSSTASLQLTLVSNSNSKVFLTPSGCVNRRADTMGTDDMADLAPGNGQPFWTAPHSSCQTELVMQFSQTNLTNRW